MSSPLTDEPEGRCLNCDTILVGPFCAVCGQRAVPPNPSVRELVGDAWAELTGYDGRIARTIATLILRPGHLTRAFIDGHRARYLSPVRLYLTASVVYFLLAAVAPDVGTARGTVRGPAFSVSITGDQNEQIEKAPRILRPVLVAITKDPAAFRRRTFETMPRVFFALLPVFAGVTALFFRGRPFPTHLTFAAHLHAFVFVLGAVNEGAKLPHSVALAGSVAAVVSLAVLVYALKSFKAVYRERWGRTLVKVAGIAVLYAVSAVPAFIVILTWAALGS